METNLKKALLASTDASALIPEDLEGVLYEELLNLQPLARLLEVEQANGKTHEFNIRSSHPQAWFEGETTPMNQKKSGYERKTVQLKIQRIWGGVTGFAQVVTDSFIDALEAELEGSLTGMADLMEFGAMFGTAGDLGFTGDAYQYSGILPRLWNDAPGNVIDAGGNKVALADLDSALAAARKHRQTRNDPYVFMMGLQMKQVVDGLQTRVQIPLRSMELFDGALVMGSYSDVPILETDYLVPESATTSPAVTAAVAAGGSLADDEWFYVISSVTMNGEQVAGTEDSAITATTNNSVALSWTADANAMLYLVFRGTVTGNANLQLLDVIAAKTYDADGTVSGNVAAYTDDGSLTPVAIKPLSSGEQTILLVNRHPRRGPRFLGLVDDMGDRVDSLIRYVELARVKDTYDYMIKSYLALKVPYANLYSQIRHATLA